jgi:hypothetical protein
VLLAGEPRQLGIASIRGCCAVCCCRGVQDRPSALEDADEEALYRRRARPGRSRDTGSFRIGCAHRDHATKSSVGDGYHLLPMARGFVYSVVVLNWFCRRVLSCVSITMGVASASRQCRMPWLVTASRKS